MQTQTPSREQAFSIIKGVATKAVESRRNLSVTSYKNDYRQTLPKLHAAQQEIVANRKRFNVVCCGRRFGKTDLSEYLLGETAISGKPGAYFAPSYKNLSETWREFKSKFVDVITQVNEQEKRLEFRGGGSIDFWSLSTPKTAQNVRGRKYARIIPDEAALIPSADIWPAVLRPMLTDYQGDAYFPSTPRGHNWYWSLYNMGLDPLQDEWASFNYPTSANTTIEGLEAEIESARLLLPDRLFRQEYLAEFIDDGGGVFRGAKAVSTLDRAMGAVGGVRYVAGVDWGKSNDFTVISVWDSAAKNEVYLERFNQVGWAFQRERIRKVITMFNIKHVLAESNSIGSPNIEALQSDGMPVQGFETTAQSKGPMIESLALAVERGECNLQSDPVALAEMQAYELERMPSGRFRYGAPDGTHDDTVIARALGWKAIGRDVEVKIKRWA